ncbi:MAG: DUF1577 domain-containing protein [Spirochaetia bacterium]|nr:DUF1577 domain-containing protein [Spirochaetia bacterium]
MQGPATYSDSLIESLRELSGSRSEDFTEETIIGSDINQIRHVFYFLRSERQQVLINYMGESYRAVVERVDNNRIILSTPDLIEGTGRRCRIKFEIINILYQFEVPILDLSRDKIVIRMPAYVQSARHRKNVRVYPRDLFMRFNLLYLPMFGRRGVGQIVENRYPKIVRELEKDIPDLALLVRIVNEAVGEISTEYEFRIYDPNVKRTFLERVMTSEKKTLYVKDTSRKDSYYSPLGLYGIINFEKEFRRIAREESLEEAENFFEKYRREELTQFLANYICAPLVVLDKVVGHILIYSTVLDKKTIIPEDAQKIDLLVQLLNYALSKRSLADTYFRTHNTRVVNLSMNGLLFEIQDQNVFNYLIDHDRLKIRIPIHSHEVEMRAEITRLLPAEKGFRVGASFFHGGPDDFRELESFVFERVQNMFH